MITALSSCYLACEGRKWTRRIVSQLTEYESNSKREEIIQKTGYELNKQLVLR